MKQLLSTLIIFLLSQNLLTAQSFVQPPAEEVQYLENKDLKINEKNGAYYNESWDYHVILNNGAEIYVTYSVSHFAGLRSAASSGRLSLLNWKNKNFSVAREYDLNLLEFDEETYRMNLHPDRGIWIEGRPDKNHRLYYRTEKDGIHYDININFDNPFPGFTQGNGVFQLGEHDQMGMFTHFPFSKVSGFVALNDDTVKVSGIGFMNHTWLTNVATRLFETSYGFNQKTENGFTGGYFMVPKDHSKEVAGYAYEFDGEKLILKLPERIHVRKSEIVRGKTIPSEIEVFYKNAYTDRFNFTDVSEKISMLDELGGLKKMMAKRFLGGEILFYRGKAKMHNAANTRDKEVYYNLSLVD